MRPKPVYQTVNIISALQLSILTWEARGTGFFGAILKQSLKELLLGFQFYPS